MKTEKLFYISEYMILILLLTIHRAPRLMSSPMESLILTGLSMVPLWFIIVREFLFKRKFTKQIRKKLAIIYAIFILIIFINLLRGLAVGSIDNFYFLRHFLWWITIVLFSIAVFLKPRDVNEIIQLRRAIYYGVGIYVVFNAALYLFAGIESNKGFYESHGIAVMLFEFGIQTERTFFPTASGINSFGGIASICTAIGLMLLLNRLGNYQNKNLIIGSIMFTTGLYVLLKVDSRAAMFWSIVTPFGILLFLQQRNIRRFLPTLAILAPVYPIILVLIMFNIADTDLAIKLARNANDNVSTLSNRTLVWSAALAELTDVSAKHIIGFGAYGQVASGISEDYSSLFQNYTSINAPLLHNFIMQYFIDTGYLGVLIIIMLLVQILKIFSQRVIPPDSSLHVTLILLLLFMGTTDTIMTPYAVETFTIWLIIITSLIRQESYHYSQHK